MKAFALRLKGTSMYLPAGKAIALVNEPLNFGGKYGPRLFTTERNAALALKYWTKQLFHRSQLQMEIVCFALVETELV